MAAEFSGSFSEEAATRFSGGYYDGIRGFVREALTRQNLLENLPDRELNILDFGGGEGRDAIWLAHMGHEVTIVDQSETMLGKAREAIAARGDETRQRIQLVRGDITAVQARGKQYGAVLSHGVLMYELENPQGQLDALSGALRPGGIMSVLTKNYYAVLARKIQQQDPDGEDFIHTQRYQSRNGVEAVAYRHRDLNRMLGRAGLTPLHNYVVRTFSEADKRTVAEVPLAERDDILEREYAARNDRGDIPGQLLHTIAQKSHAG